LDLLFKPGGQLLLIIEYQGLPCHNTLKIMLAKVK